MNRGILFLTALLLLFLQLLVEARAESGTPPPGIYLAKPEDIALRGSLRRQTLTSPLGIIEARWPRKVETLFGRTPERALVDAAQAVSRALRRGGFPPELQRLTLPWEVVFMDEELPEKQIPESLVTNCHPAWMTPIANLYIVGQRVVAGCSGLRGVPQREADVQLANVLIHEMGHAVEYQLLEGLFPEDRVRAEGFATWFQMYAADYSSVLPSGQVRRSYRETATAALQRGPRAFSGTVEDYAIASLVFDDLVQKKGVRALVEVYERMKREKVSFAVALGR